MASIPKVAFPLDTLRDRIAEAVAGNFKAYNVPSACARFGIQEAVRDTDDAGAFSSKRIYTKKRLAQFDQRQLLDIAEKILLGFDAPELADVVGELITHSANRVSDITRRDVLKCLNQLGQLFNDVPVFDGLNIVASPPLSIPEINSPLAEYLPSISRDVYQHYVKNSDYSHEYVLIHCGALTCSQGRFFALIEKVLDPVVRRDEEQLGLAESIAAVLQRDGFSVAVAELKSGYPVYRVVQQQGGVSGTVKNLIFASVGEKPELIFRDAINNDVEVVKHADKILVYDRPLPPSGMLRWKDLEVWWKESKHATTSKDAKAQLYLRLVQSVRQTGSPGELAIFHTYHKAFGKKLGDRLPALIPQVYLHYDPYTKRQRGDEQFLVRQRMDFLLLLEHGVRIILEVDGQQHYAVRDGNRYAANPSLYAAMATEDRRLRLAGYEVYRFGAAEFADVELGQPIIETAVGPVSQKLIEEFFEHLFSKHHVA
jgi:hypothetical protein